MKEKKMKKGIEKKIGRRDENQEVQKAEGQTGQFAKKETMAEGKIGPRKQASPREILDTVRKLKELQMERRLMIIPSWSPFLGKSIDVDSMSPWVQFDLGAMKVLEEAQERGLLSKMSTRRFSKFEGPLREETAKTEEEKKRVRGQNATFLRFFQALQE